MNRFTAVVAWLAIAAAGPAGAQLQDPGAWLNRQTAEETGGRLKFGFEFRNRFESRTGESFGRSPDLLNPVLRTRLSAHYRATEWLSVSAMAQDARAPLYGRPAPGSVRDTIDLQEAFAELFPARDTGFGATLGRQAVNLGEGRLIGAALWANTSRTYDGVRAYYRLPRARIEVLALSIVQVRPDAFNRPQPGDRLWGTYNSFSGALPRGVLDVYLLRRDQNCPAGFAGPGRLAVNTLGGRAAGPLRGGVRYSLEGAAQNGRAGALPHRGYAWFSNVARTFGRLEISAEYKYASGSDRPGERDGTFDQLYAANHDRFGHADLFGWRNLHDVRSLAVFRLSRPVTLNCMYNNFWLATPHDALYNAAGRAIATARNGAAGRHVGQEADVFGVYRAGPLQFGAGVAQVFPGAFLKHATPGAGTRYLYVFQAYGF